MTTGTDGLFSPIRFMPSNAWCRGSYMPGPHMLNSVLRAGSNPGARPTMAPTLRSWFAHPSRRLPMPVVNELSTFEWQSAHVIPMLVSLPDSSTLPITPTTAFSRSNSIVTVGSFRSTVSALSASTIDRGSALASTLRPTDSAVSGLRVWTASCSRKTLVQSCSSPNVSYRKISRPSNRRWLSSRADADVKVSVRTSAIAAAPMSRMTLTPSGGLGSHTANRGSP